MAKQCMTVVDTDRLQSVAEALRCRRHDDGSDGEAWRVMIGPRNATLSRQHEFSRWMSIVLFRDFVLLCSGSVAESSL